MEKQKNNIQTFEYKAEMKQLLDLIIHSLYTHPEIFLRELISNSADALNKIRFRKLTDKNILDQDAPLEIKIEVDSKRETFSIEDTGIGMTKEELINNIGTIANSGTLDFIKIMQQQGKQGLDEKLIGQFGVGFYAVFMVTDEVTIETRCSDINEKAYSWKSTGTGTFTITECEKKHRGTKISFKVKESAKEFSQNYRIKEIINKYSNFVNFPIFLGKEKINTINALWYKKPEQTTSTELNEFYKFISNSSEPPLGHLQLSIEGTVSFKALLFIPENAPYDLLRSIHDEKSLNLYSNKVLIQSDCKPLLPEYLRFVKGVVDTADLPLNVSREITQSNPAMTKINQVITGKILSLLDNWAKNDKEKYFKFYKNFGPLLKTGINSDFYNRDKIIDLLRFNTSFTNDTNEFELISLKAYTQRMKEGQKEIYYLSGEHKEILDKNPNLEYFKENNIEVLLVTEPVEVFIMPSINEYDKKPLKSIDKADIDLIQKNKIETPEDKLSTSLLSVFKTTLADRVENVLISKRLINSPATLVVGKQGMDTQMEKMLKMMQKDFKGAKKILEINMSHPLIKNLSKMYIADSSSELLKKCILQLYDGVSFTDGNIPQAAEFTQRMVEIMQEATN
ncbi:MAG: molecular chaperone HtpG [Candidatus Omnitrophota bacterium]|nr:MAG: molecular chaperone HtpG [Candidatus Omnitrophota bacterium]